MNNNSLITVAIPVYNVERYLHKCLKSILSQTYTNLQILLVDDGSTDGSLQICKAYEQQDQRVQVFHIPNGGVSVARNVAIDHAKGEYLCFVDSDDYLPKDSITNLYEGIVYQQSDLCCGAWAKITALHTTYNCYFSRSIHTEDKLELFQFLQIEEVNGPVAKLYKTKIIQANVLYFCKGMKIGEDALFNYQYIQQCKKVSFIDKIVYYYNKLNANSVTHVFYADFPKCSYLCAKEQAQNIVSEQIPDSFILAQKIFCERFLSAIKYIAYYRLPLEQEEEQYLQAFHFFYNHFDEKILRQKAEPVFEEVLDLLQCYKEKNMTKIHTQFQCRQTSKTSILKKIKMWIVKGIARIKVWYIFRK